jgi:thioredoxin 1
MINRLLPVCIFLTALSSAAIAQQPNVTVLSGADAEGLIQNSKIPVVVQLEAGWCGPCRTMNPVLDQVHASMNGRVKIIRINVDADPKLASKYEVMSIPTYLLFKGGTLASRQVGAASKDKLRQWINSSIAK